MQNNEIKISIIFMAVSLQLANPACAFDMGNMMNPTKWMGGNKDKDRDDDYYGEQGYGYPGGPVISGIFDFHISHFPDTGPGDGLHGAGRPTFTAVGRDYSD